MLTGTTTLGQSEPESNGNEEVLHTSQNFRTGASHHQMQFSVIQKTLFFGKGLTPQQGIQSVYSKPH